MTEPLMKFITVRDLRTSPAQIWRDLPRERELVITNNGRPTALLTPVTDETLEETLAALRQARAIQAVRRIREEAHEQGLDRLTPEEIDAEIRQSRAERHG